MAMLIYAFPILIFIGAVCCAFIDINQPKGPIFVGSIIFVLLVCLSFNIFLIVGINSEKQELSQKVESGLNWQKSTIYNLQNILIGLSPNTEKKKEAINKLVMLGWTVENPAFKEALAAAEQRQQLMALVTPPSRPVSINNLPSSVDPLLVQLALEELGHKLENQSSTEADLIRQEEGAEVRTEPEKNHEQENKSNQEESPISEANVLFYGKLVRNSDIKLITFTLMQAGVQLKMLRPFQSPTVDNANRVELDWSNMYKSRPSITVESLVKAESFKR